ncbi:citrate lyase subunit alpha [Collinsella tanakaei]|nr:citrate lyase subunit alpha [Collinsella tanakaei]
MINAVGRDIPDYLLADGKEVYQGRFAKDGQLVKRDSPTCVMHEKPVADKLCASIREACEHCDVHDGMTISFHSEFRNGDYTASQVVKVLVEDFGVRDLHVAATSLGDAHDLLADYIEQGIITHIESSGVRGRIGEAISHGKLKEPAIIRSHGGRPRAMMAGELHVDVAFLAASTSDKAGNASGVGGKNNCGSLGFAIPDSQYADKVVIITDTLVDFPNVPASIKCEDVDYVVVVDEIGDPKRIASKEARFTQDPRELMMAKNAADVIAALPYFKNGFSFQTGVGGPSLAVNRFLEDHMREKNIKMGFALGGVSGAICNLLDKGLVGKIIDVQDFDQTAINHLANNPNHVEMSQSEYANPGSKGSFVNYLDYMVLSALEIDTKFNVNVVTGSDGVVRGAPGGHPDTAATSKCCIIVTPLVRGRMPVVCKDVTTVTTPGECVDVLVTDYGTAVNPARTDIIECLDAAGIPHVSIESLQEKAYSIVGEPDPLQWEDKVVAIVEARDGTILDVIRQIKPYDFA